jgi:hypothetical protein
MLTWRSTPYLRELEKSYDASRFLDTRTTFVSEKQILAGNLSKFKVLIVPATSHTRAEVMEAIHRYVEQGGTVVILPSSFLSDEYNRPTDYLRRIGIQVQRIEQPSADRTGEMEQAYDQSFHERVVYRSQQIVDLKTQQAGLFGKRPPNLQAEGTRQDITVSGTYEKLAVFPGGRPALVSLSRGHGLIYYSATSFSKASLGSLLDRVFEVSGVDRPVRIRGENGKPLGEVEARYALSSSGKLLYLVNFNETPVVARIEVKGQATPRLFELRKQEKLSTNLMTTNSELLNAVHDVARDSFDLSLSPGETVIVRLD